jgi:hypothetical protein
MDRHVTRAFLCLSRVCRCGHYAGSRVLFLRRGKASCQLDAENAVVTGTSSLVTTPLVARKVVTEERNVVVRATAEVVVATEAGSAAEAPPVDGISTLLSERELLKRKAKRAELRRKRLVRKRKLRKKGKWPPSKMAKLKNV